MKIYTIEHEKHRYDAFLGHVIVANTEEEVRQLAKNTNGDEGQDVWNTAKVEEHGNYTGTNTEPFILMSDFHAG